ncbi:MAG: hypothetical protein RLZZ598_892 [Pseudomonadota bacterium]|jgi:N-acetylglucosaminyl-diphospho-decaprenol L-rhamnosyltransferase
MQEAVTTVRPPVEVSVLIVNYNGRHLLEACLQALERNLATTHEVLLVDNASQDDSLAFLAQQFPWIRVIASPVNTGFTGGNNIAAREARGRLLLLLNTDTEIRTPLAPLLSLMNSQPDCGALGCRLIYSDDRQQESIGYEPSTLRLVFSWLPLGRWLPRWSMVRRTLPAASPLYRNTIASAQWVSGAFLLTPRALWNSLGGLDERFFMYMEDTDYCRRVREAGHRVLYSALCEVTHFEGAGRPWIGERAVLNTTDSYLAYMRKFRGRFALLALRVLLSAVFLARSMANGVAVLTGRDPYGREKSQAFRRAAWRLLGAGRQVAR